MIQETIKKLLGGHVEPEAAPEPVISDRLSDDPIRNGIHAEQLLNDPLLKQCFENVRTAYLRKFEAVTMGDVESLKLIHLSLSALGDVKRALLAYRFNGQAAVEKQDGKGTSRSINQRTVQKPINRS